MLWMLILHRWIYDRLFFLLVSVDFSIANVIYAVRHLLGLLWLPGALAMGVWQFISYQRFRRRALACMHPVKDSWMKSALEQAACEAGCKKVPPLYQSSAVSTPLILGFAVPVMLVPEQEYTWAELRMVFLHECTHVRQRDLWYKLCFTVGLCLLWFQPLFWILKRTAFKDVETACDQSVVKGKSEADRRVYGDFLLASLRKGKNRELPYSAYFYNSKSVMKARLAVVEDNREHSGFPGAAVCAVLAVLTIGAAVDRIHVRTEELWEEYKASMPQNIYEGYTPPESFTEETTCEMAEIIIQGQEGKKEEEERQQTARTEEGAVPEEGEKQEQGTPPELVAEGPWQVQNAQNPQQAATALVYRLISYYGNQEYGNRLHSDLSLESGYSLMSVLENEILGLCGDEAVCALRVRFFPMNEEDSSSLRSIPGAQAGFDEGYEQFYYEWAVRIRRDGDNIWELTGAALLEDVLQQCEAEGMEIETGFAELDLWTLPRCRARTQNGVTEVTWDGGASWKELPVPLEELTARGDQMDGALTGIQEKSYVVSEEMAAFAYGGSAEVPVKVTWTTDQGEHWTTSVVTYGYPDVRRLFVSFPDAEHGFLVLTAGRTVWQEGDSLFRTEDGGRTWIEVQRENAAMYQGGTHSLTMGAEFLTPEIGFMAIRSSQEPELYRTEDGGVNWEKCVFPEADAEYAEYYTMAYVPEQKEDRICVYLSMEEYTELGGTKLRYESTDLGKTWTYTGEVLRK